VKRTRGVALIALGFSRPRFSGESLHHAIESDGPSSTQFDGRVATVMTAKKYKKLRLIDFFPTNAALRLNGNVWSIFSVKLAVLATNLLPLVVAKKMRPEPWVWVEDSAEPFNGSSMTAIERALGVRASGSSCCLAALS
jgi:hypothetical protein